MAQTIKLKRTAVASRIPTTSGLNLGEVAINTYDGKLFIKKNVGGTESIVEIGDASAYLPLSGGTMTGNLVFGDNNKIQLGGTTTNLELYHDGSNSIISESGAGSLLLRGTNLSLQSDDNDNFVQCLENGAVTLYHQTGGSTAPKLATTSTGIDVTGTVVADGLTVDGTVSSPPIVRISNTGVGGWAAGNETGRLQFYISDGSGIGAREVASIRAATNQGGTTTDGTLEFWTSPYNTVAKKSMEINGVTGDVSFYEDTGTTAKFFWDASTERLGIGTISPDSALQVVGGDFTLGEADTAEKYIILQSSGASTKGIKFNRDSSIDASLTMDSTEDLVINYAQTDLGGRSLNIKRGSAGTDVAVFDSSGNVGIGTTGPTGKLHITGSGVSSSTYGLRVYNSTPTESFSVRDDGLITMAGSSFVHVTKGLGLYVDNNIAARGLIWNDQGDVELYGDTKVSSGDLTVPSGKVGIGTTAPSSQLHLQKLNDTANSNIATMRFTDTDPAAATGQIVGRIEFECVDISSAGVGSYIQAVQKDTGNNHNLVFGTGQGGSATEAMRIDSSGNVLVGTTSASIYNDTSGNGINLKSGQIIVAKESGSASDPAMILNNTGVDGNILQLAKDGATVGSISVASGNNLTIEGMVASHAGLQLGTNMITPRVAGVNSDGAVDLGFSNQRFKDLRLSGGVYLGGTGAANKLDDYEEGNWTPTAVTGCTGMSVTRATYTKIGNAVTVRCYIGGLIGTSANLLQIDGLPFTSASNGWAVGSMNYGGSVSTVNPQARVRAGVARLDFKCVGDASFLGTYIGNTHLIFTVSYESA